LFNIIKYILEDLIRNISGPVGIRFRRLYYSKVFKKCGQNLVIGPGVHFDNPQYISVGNNVWIDRQSVIIAGKNFNQNFKPLNKSQNIGELIIGDNAHIGVRTVIQAHGGVKIGNNFTCGTDSKLYTFSNDVKNSKFGTHNLNKEILNYLMHPIEIGDNVWVGMQAVILGGIIENDVFIKINSVSTINISQNSVVEGTPAVKVKNRFN